MRLRREFVIFGTRLSSVGSTSRYARLRWPSKCSLEKPIPRASDTRLLGKPLGSPLPMSLTALQLADSQPARQTRWPTGGENDLRIIRRSSLQTAFIRPPAGNARPIAERSPPSKSGKVVNYAPNPASPHSAGAFCIKGIRGAPGLTYNPNRLLYPHRRVGARGEGRWARISWDEALDEMADRFAEVRRTYGPEAIVGATSGAAFSRSIVTALTLRSIGSPNWMINQDLCGGCRAVSAKITGLPIARGEDIDNTRCALIVGRNAQIADPVEWAKLKSAKKRGARMIVIDPKRTTAAELADIWMSPRVGTDAAVALAMMHVLISEDLYDRQFVQERCHGFDALAERATQFSPATAESMTGVPAEQIVNAARMYADGPSTFVSGHGIDAASNGVQTFRAFHALAAISGNIDRPGGNLRQRTPKGLTNYLELLHRPEHRLPADVEARTIGADRFPLWAGPRGWQTACHNPSVIEAMLTGKPHPVRALYASGVNILVTYPDTRRTIAALRSLDFVAVAAHQMTPTAEWADIVLPKTTTLEEEEVMFVPSGPTVVFTRADGSATGRGADRDRYRGASSRPP